MKLLPIQLNLQNICHIRIVISLLNAKTDIIGMLCLTYYERFTNLLQLNRRLPRNAPFNQAMESFGAMYHESQRKFSADLLTDIDTLEVPIQVKIKIKGVALVMGRKLLNWCYRIKRIFNTFPPILWTPTGTIDEDEILELMLKNEDLDFLTRFQIACYTCNEDCIREMWPDVPNSYKLQCAQAMTTEVFYEDFNDLFLPKSVWYNAVRKNQSMLQTMLVASLHTSNWRGVKYFWANLNQQYRQQFLTERENFIRKRMMLLPRTHENCDTICRFYWQILNESDRRLADNALLPYMCFNMLLMWPWHQHLQEFIESRMGRFAMAAIGENQRKILNFFKTDPMRTLGAYHRACNELYEMFTYGGDIHRRRLARIRERNLVL